MRIELNYIVVREHSIDGDEFVAAFPDLHAAEAYRDMLVPIQGEWFVVRKYSDLVKE